MRLLVSALVASAALAFAVAPPDPLAAAPSRFATLDGARIHYKTFGRGDEAFVLVHGWSCDLTVWRDQVTALANQGQVVALDLPGHGRSDKPDLAYGPEIFARAVEAVMRDAGLRRATLIGHSNGTHVVRHFYRLFPDKARALVVVDGNLRPLPDLARYQAFGDRFGGPDYKEKAGGFIDGLLAAEPSAEKRVAIKAMMMSTPQMVMVRSLQNLKNPAFWEPDPIGVPLLVVLARSPYWTAEDEAAARGLAHDTEYVVMDGVSHFLMMDKPAEFNALVLAFLEKRKTPTP